MRVDEVMSAAKCCRPDATVQDCARMMRDENIGFIPICDEQGKPVGAITDRDIAVRVVAEGKTGSERARTFMTRDLVGCRLGEDVSAAERLMRHRQVSRVMVCDERGRLQGVISLQDLSEAAGEEDTGRTVAQLKTDQPSMH